jgi:ApaG protein
MSDDVTHRIEVNGQAIFLPEQSDIVADKYVFGYTVTIRNSGSIPAQLVSRHWVITDALKRVQEVRGQGVVGEQPWLAPGQQFEYTSSASIGTPVGTMHGSYQMVAADGTRFEAEIPPFQLRLPRTLH